MDTPQYIPNYTFTCPKCSWHWIYEITTQMEERSSLADVDIYLTEDGHYRVSPKSYSQTETINTIYSIHKFVCGNCNRELTEDDLQRIVFDKEL